MMHRSKTLSISALGFAVLGYVLPFVSRSGGSPNIFDPSDWSPAVAAYGFDHPEATIDTVLLVGLAVALSIGKLSRPPGRRLRAICRVAAWIVLVLVVFTCGVLLYRSIAHLGPMAHLVSIVLVLASIRAASKPGAPEALDGNGRASSEAGASR